MRFLLTDITGRSVQMDQYHFFELNQSMDIPCDSLCVSFPLQALNEIETIEVWQGTRKLFYGPVDTQTAQRNKAGGSVTFWARSAAAYLVDNECIPCAYQMPTADTLIFRYAAEYGIENCLPPVMLENTLEIPKGSSRWNAIDTLVKSSTGRQIYVNSEKQLSLYTPTGQQWIFSDKTEEALCVTEAAVRIKRSAPVTRVVYKTENDEPYRHRAEQTDLNDRRIHKSRCMNLASLPPWRREAAVAQLLSDSRREYKTIHLKVTGLPPLALYDAAVFDSDSLGGQTGLILTELCLRSDSNGESCAVTLCPEQEDQIEFYID